MTRNLRQHWLIYCLLIAVTLPIYLQTVKFPFVNYDDYGYIVLNPHIKRGINARSIAWAFDNRRDANWMPLVWISFMVDHITGGSAPYSIRGHEMENPAPYHRTNVILHVLNTLLLFAVLNAATGMRWRSAFVAALFGVHPLHVESVAWVAERKDCLSTLFGLLTLGAYVWYARRPSVGRYAAAAAAFALGLMSKSMLVTVPVLMLLLDFWPLRRLAENGKRKADNKERSGQPSNAGPFALLVEKVPFVGMSLAVGIVTVMQQAHAGAVKAVATYPMGIRLPNAIVSYAAYVYKMFWPTGLCAAYPHPRDTLPETLVVTCAVAFGAVTAAAVALRRRAPYLLVGWLWYVIALLPVIGIIQIGDQAMADRYAYIPLIGLFIAAAWGIPELIAVRARWALPAAACAAVVALGWAAHAQAQYWRSDLALYGRAVDVTVRNPFAQRGLGAALEDEKKDYRAAIAHYRIAASYWNDDITYYRLGQALHRTGNIAEAAEAYRAALKLRSSHFLAANNLAYILATSSDPAVRDPDEAVKWAKLACRNASKQKRADAMDTLAIAYASAGRWQDAIRTAQRGAALAEAQHKPALARDIAAKLAAYRAHRPYHP